MNICHLEKLLFIPKGQKNWLSKETILANIQKKNQGIHSQIVFQCFKYCTVHGSSPVKWTQSDVGAVKKSLWIRCFWAPFSFYCQFVTTDRATSRSFIIIFLFGIPSACFNKFFLGSYHTYLLFLFYILLYKFPLIFQYINHTISKVIVSLH